MVVWYVWSTWIVCKALEWSLFAAIILSSETLRRPRRPCHVAHTVSLPLPLSLSLNRGSPTTSVNASAQPVFYIVDFREQYKKGVFCGWSIAYYCHTRMWQNIATITNSSEKNVVNIVIRGVTHSYIVDLKCILQISAPECNSLYPTSDYCILYSPVGMWLYTQKASEIECF